MGCIHFKLEANTLVIFAKTYESKPINLLSGFPASYR